MFLNVGIIYNESIDLFSLWVSCIFGGINFKFYFICLFSFKEEGRGVWSGLGYKGFLKDLFSYYRLVFLFILNVL